MRFQKSVIVGLLLCLQAGGIATSGQEQQEKPRRKIIIATTPEEITGRFTGRDGRAIEVKGEVVFRITSVNSDDTMYGDLTLRFAEAVRREIAQATGKGIADVPELVVKQEVTAWFEPSASCPRIGVLLGLMQVDLAGEKISYDKFKLSFIETPAEESQLVCKWARCVFFRGFACDRGYAKRLTVLLNGSEREQ